MNTTVASLNSVFIEYLIGRFAISQTDAERSLFTLNSGVQRSAFGDANSNAPLVLAKKVQKTPRQIAEEIIDTFKHHTVQSAEIAGPGFINITFTPETFAEYAAQLFNKKELLCKAAVQPKQKKSFLIEFISANPTGPLHFGHGRGGIIGDVLARVLRFIGHHVATEFYINDAGNQMEKLGQSLRERCKQVLNKPFDIPEHGYHGEYLILVAQECVADHGASVIDKPTQFFSQYAEEKLLALIKSTVADYGITFESWFSERTLHESGAVARVIELLLKKGAVYEKDSALWLASTRWGDDKDRVVKKASGDYTYAAADIAYLENKVHRGYTDLIYILGHDHHSYAQRLDSMRYALDYRTTTVTTILYQLVKMKANGSRLRMSKRTGSIITLRDIIETVGTDVARFFYLQRKADSQLEFDLDLALSKTDENPMYYIQYAYVRCNSILYKAAGIDLWSHISEKDVARLEREEHEIIKKIGLLPDILKDIERTLQPHTLTTYTHELAQLFNKYYAANRVIDPTLIQKSRARLLMIHIIRDTLQCTLTLLGISRPERM